jgi:hypothetical protein
MQISAAAPMTPVKTFDIPSALQLKKPMKNLAITQIALVALSVVGAISFIIATAVTLNAYLLIGAGLCGIVALAILGRNLCCRSMLKQEETAVFIPGHESSYQDQAFVQGFQAKSPLVRRPIPWPDRRMVAGQEIPGQRYSPFHMTSAEVM